MIVKRDSWHYKLLAYTTVMRNYFESNAFIVRRLDKTYVDIYESGIEYSYWEHPSNFCSYVQRAFILPLFCFVVNLLVAAALIMIVVTNFTTVGTGALMVIGLIAAVILFVGAVTLTVCGAKKLGTTLKESEGLIASGYSMYKDKVCILIKIEDKK